MTVEIDGAKGSRVTGAREPRSRGAAERRGGKRRRLLAMIALITLAGSGIQVKGDDAAPGVVGLDLFPTGYDQSRARFRQSCRQAIAKHAGYCRSFPIPSRVDGDLTIDYGYLTAHGTRLLVLQSGIHGPESYAGAAVQELLLRDFADRLLERGVDLLLIHALNPYGFRHDRRADEANVNLNRNFSPDGSIYRLDAPSYARLRWIFEPEGSPGSVWWDSLLSDLRFVWALVATGFDYRLINDAMNQGQYRFDRGLNYGGSGPRPQTRFLVEEIGPILRAYPGDVLFLDFHTGLGEDGVLHIMSGLRPPPAMVTRAQGLLGSLSSEGIRLTTSSEPGFYSDTGDVIDFISTLAADPNRVLAFTLEYGTMGTGTLAQLETAARIVLENQAHFYGCTDPAVCDEIRANFLELFNPSDRGWRATTMREANRVLTILTERF